MHKSRMHRRRPLRRRRFFRRHQRGQGYDVRGVGDLIPSGPAVANLSVFSRVVQAMRGQPRARGG